MRTLILVSLVLALATPARADVVTPVSDARSVHLAEHRMLASGAERAERPAAVAPYEPVGRLRQCVAAHDPQPEPRLDLLLALTIR